MVAVGAMTTALCIVDLWIATGVLGGGLRPVPGLSVHYAAVLGLGGLLLARGRAHRSESVAWIGVAMLFGPIAGMALAGMIPVSRIGSSPSGSRTPDLIPDETPAQILAARVRDGRRQSLSGTLPPSYDVIFAGDDLDLQQRAMSAMSRDWRPALRPALQGALESEIPAIRVQAAAIHAKLRGQHDRAVRDLSQQDAVHDAETARRAVEIARSGFVSPEAAAALLRQADRVGTIAASARQAPETGKLRGLSPPPRLKRHACGGIA